MAERIVVIEMDTVFTRVVEMEYATKKPKIYNYFIMETPAETARDGNVRLNEEFVSSFKNNYSICGMKAKQCVFLLDSGRIICRDLIIPYVKPGQIQGVVDGMFSECFPVDPEQYHTKYYVVNADKEENKIELKLLAIPNDLTGGYFEVAKALDLTLVDIRYVGTASVLLNKIMSGESVYESALLHQLPQSVVSAVEFAKLSKKKTEKEPVPEEQEENVQNVREDGAIILGKDATDNDIQLKCFVKLENYSTFITIIKDGQAVMQRSVSVGISGLIEYIMSEDIFGDELNKSDALNVLRNNNLLNRTFEESTDYKDQYLEIKNNVTAEIETVTASMVRAIEYYTAKNEGEYIKQMYITGCGACIKGLGRLLQNELGYNVEIVSDFPDISFYKDSKSFLGVVISQKIEAPARNGDAAEGEKPEQEQEPAQENTDTVFSMDDLDALMSKKTEEAVQPLKIKKKRAAENTEEGTPVDAEPEPEEKFFDCSVFALLVVSGLAYGGIVSEEERFGDATMAKIIKDRKITMWCTAGGVILIAAACGLALISSSNYKKKLAEKEKISKGIETFEEQGVEDTYAIYNAKINETAELENILVYTHSANENLVAFIKEFQDKIPSETVVLSLVATDNGITMSLQSPDKMSVAKTIMMLRTFETIETVSSDSLSDSDTYSDRESGDETGERTVSYSVSLTYRSSEFDVEAFLESRLAEQSDGQAAEAGEE